MLTIQLLFAAIQDEIDQIKSGQMPAEVAAQVLKARKLQVQEHGHALTAIELSMQAHKTAVTVEGLNMVLQGEVLDEAAEPKKIEAAKERRPYVRKKA